MRFYLLIVAHTGQEWRMAEMLPGILGPVYKVIRAEVISANHVGYNVLAEVEITKEFRQSDVINEVTSAFKGVAIFSAVEVAFTEKQK